MPYSSGASEALVIVDHLREMIWPEEAVFLIDRGLPGWILEAFDPARSILTDSGEPLKRLERLGELAERVLNLRATRPLTLVAVGGGSLGDAVGFLASILWRGVGLWHLPTTLVAMVDSAHGGKTAVNLGAAKNQLGTFYAADQVVIVREILARLPIAQRKEGLTELLKGLWLGDAPLLEELDSGELERVAYAPPSPQLDPRLERWLMRAIEVKRQIVRQDPRELKGIRTWLNFGHTAAHALELELGAPHGLAVAWGMAAASRLSLSQAELFPMQADRLLAHLEPLLEPLSRPPGEITVGRFEALVGRDKKRVLGTLRSVLLDAPGEPVVVNQVSPAAWHEALGRIYRERLEGTYSVRWSAPRAVSVSLEASKSEMNRALLIAALRPGLTRVRGESGADDVARCRRAAEALREAPEGAPLSLQAGLGGTTLRFLLAACLTRTGVTTIAAQPSLLKRPHLPLIEAMRQAGATVTVHQDAIEVSLSEPLDELEVNIDLSSSSQYASALCLLSSHGVRCRLRLTTSSAQGARGAFDPEAAVSLSYLRMTLEMLKQAGVATRFDEARGVIELDPDQEALERPCELTAYPDESSAAFWRVAAFLGAPVELLGLPRASRQADRALEGILERLKASRDDEQTTIEVDLHEAPDLAPVLSVAAAHARCGLLIRGASHLRHKESNRIEDLIEAFAQVGITGIEPREDGLLIPPGEQRASGQGVWPTCEDHRLAMAGLLCALAHPLRIAHPWAIVKSYPGLIHEMRRAGASFSWERGGAEEGAL